LHDSVQGRAGGLQKQFQIFEDAARLARHRAVLAMGSGLSWKMVCAAICRRLLVAWSFTGV
jgi:hypothetical protein